jgi:hypothetical protein
MSSWEKDVQFKTSCRIAFFTRTNVGWIGSAVSQMHRMQSFISIVYLPYFDLWDATSVFVLLKTPKAKQLLPWPTPVKIGNTPSISKYMIF